MKNQAVKRKLAETYKALALSRPDVCVDCSNSKGYPNSWAHIISRNRCRQIGKIELIWNPENIKRRCQGATDSCHYIYDNSSIGEKTKLKTFLSDLKFMQIHDNQGFKSKMLAIESEDKALFLEYAKELGFKW